MQQMPLTMYSTQAKPPENKGLALFVVTQGFRDFGSSIE